MREISLGRWGRRALFDQTSDFGHAPVDKALLAAASTSTVAAVIVTGVAPLRGRGAVRVRGWRRGKQSWGILVDDDKGRH